MGLSDSVQNCPWSNSFDLVFGLNAITPLDYLVPTLRVAHDFEWTGYELSARIDELEALDELRLLALVGMYAEKRIDTLAINVTLPPFLFPFIMHVIFLVQ